jgi:hypothetical protein
MKEWFFLVVTLVAISSGGFLLIQKYDSIQQPINFSHEIHTSQAECAFCHQYVQQLPAAGLPDVARCMTCHQASLTEHPEALKLQGYFERGEEIPWVRLFQLDSDLIFSHATHVRQGIECQRCHGDVGELGRRGSGFGRRGATGPYGVELMNFCLSCHRQRGASTDCLTCHK